MVTNSIIVDEIEKQPEANLEFLKKSGIVLLNMVLEMLGGSFKMLDGNAMNLNSNQNKITAKTSEFIKGIEALSVNSKEIKFENFKIIVEENKAVLKYNDFVVASFDEEEINIFVKTSFFSKVNSGNMSAYEFFNSKIESDKDSAVIKTTIFKEPEGLLAKTELELFENDIFNRLEKLKNVQMEVEKLLNKNISPVLFIQTERGAKIEVGFDTSNSNINVDSSGEFVIFSDKRFSVSEKMKIYTDYFENDYINTFLNKYKNYNRVYGENGNIDFMVDGDIIVSDGVDRYYVNFTNKDKSYLRIILFDKDQNLRNIEFSECKIFKENLGVFSEEVLDFNGTSFFDKEGIEIELINPSLSRNIVAIFNIDTELNQNFRFEKKIKTNRNITLNLKPSFMIEDIEETGYKVYFTDENSDSISDFSRKVQFGFLTESEQENNFRSGKKDFSVGLKDEETGVYVPLSSFLFSINVPVPDIEDGDTIDLLKAGEFVVTAAKSSNTVIFNCNGTSFTCNELYSLNIKCEIFVKNGKVEKIKSYYPKEIISVDKANYDIFLKNICEKTGLIDEYDNFVEVFLDELKFDEKIVNRKINFIAEVNTDIKKYSMAKNIMFIPKEIEGGDITVNGMIQSEIEFYKRVSSTPIENAWNEDMTESKKVFLGEDIRISFSEKDFIMNNPEVTGFEFEIYDGLNYNVLKSVSGKKIYKDSTKPCKLIYNKNAKGKLIYDVSSSTDEDVFSENNFEIKYPSSYELFDEKSRTMLIRLTIKRSVGENVVIQKTIKTIPNFYEFEIKFENKILEEGENEKEVVVDQGKSLDDNGKKVFFGCVKNTLNLKSYFDLRFQKEISIKINFDSGIWFTEINESNIDSFLQKDYIVDRNAGKLTGTGFCKLQFKFNENDEMEFSVLDSSGVKRTEWEKYFYIVGLNDFYNITINIGFIVKRFNQNITFELDNTNLSGNSKVYNVEEYIKLNIDSEFLLSELNQNYKNANSYSNRNTPQMYLLSPLSNEYEGILSYINRLKLRIDIEEPAATSTEFYIAPVKLEAGKIVIKDPLNSIKEEVVLVEGENFREISFEVDMGEIGKERGYIIFGYIKSDVLEDELLCRVFMGDDENNMVEMKNLLKVKNYNQSIENKNMDIQMIRLNYTGYGELRTGIDLKYKTRNKITGTMNINYDIKLNGENLKNGTASIGNYNSALGVDLTLFEMPEYSYCEVLERGTFDISSVTGTKYTYDVNSATITLNGENADYSTVLSIFENTFTLKEDNDIVVFSNIQDDAVDEKTGNFFVYILNCLFSDFGRKKDIFMNGETIKTIEFEKTGTIDKNIKRLMFENIQISFNDTNFAQPETLVMTPTQTSEKVNMHVKLSGTYSGQLKHLIKNFDLMNNSKYRIDLKIKAELFVDGDTNEVIIPITNKNIVVVEGEPCLIKDVFSIDEIFQGVGDPELFLLEMLVLDFKLIVYVGDNDYSFGFLNKVKIANSNINTDIQQVIIV